VIRIRLIDWEVLVVLVVLVEWEASRFEEGESIRVKESKAFERVTVKGVGEEDLGDQDEEEESREVLSLLLLLLMLQVFLLLMLILMVKDMVKHVEKDVVKDEVVTLTKEARFE